METTKVPDFYKTLILEIRPRLQSVNVLIALATSVKDIKVVLNKDNFQVFANDDNATIYCKKLKIVPESLTSLSFTDSYISFRFATESCLDDWGTFKAELLKISESKTNQEIQKTFLEQSVLYDVECGNCSQKFGESLQFDRILPLPSDCSEPSDWFCHGHVNFNLNPKESDFFYGQCYCHLNRKLVKNILVDDKIIVCKRCFSWLGLPQNSDTIKLWFNTVNFKNADQILNSYPLEDVIKSVRESLSNVLFNTAKVLLCCQSTKTQTDYILLWVLEKELSVEIMNSTQTQECKVAKVLFKFENNSSDIVKKWEDDSGVSSINVSKPMIVELLKHLYKYNKIFPKEFRESNHFYISYVKYDEKK